MGTDEDDYRAFKWACILLDDHVKLVILETLRKLIYKTSSWPNERCTLRWNHCSLPRFMKHESQKNGQDKQYTCQDTHLV